MNLPLDVAAVLAGDKRWAVVPGNCLELMAALPPHAVDHVITDPPYSRHVHSKSRAGTRALPMGNGKPTFNREHEFGFEHLTPETRRGAAYGFARVCKRWVAVFSDTESDWLWRLSLTVAGFDYVRTGFWQKEGATPQFTGDRPAVAVEAITLAHPNGRKRWNGHGKHALWSHPVVQRRGAAVNTRVHTAQKPVELMLDLVRDFTNEGDIILDAFCGSGTTMVAALRLGRRVIGVELDPKHTQTAIDRCTAEEHGSTLEALRAGQMTLL